MPVFRRTCLTRELGTMPRASSRNRSLCSAAPPSDSGHQVRGSCVSLRSGVLRPRVGTVDETGEYFLPTQRRSGPRLRSLLKESTVATDGSTTNHMSSQPSSATPPPPFRASVALTGVIHVSGELDLATRDQLVSVITAGRRPMVEVHLGGCTFMDCSGYGALVASRLVIEAQGRSLAITGQTGQPAVLWKLIADLDHDDDYDHEAATRGGHLQNALHSRIAIEQAKGMLAERHEVDMDAAFTQLRAFARNNNRGITEVAESLIAGKITVGAIVAKRLPHHRSPTDDPVAVLV